MYLTFFMTIDIFLPVNGLIVRIEPPPPPLTFAQYIAITKAVLISISVWIYTSKIEKYDYCLLCYELIFRMAT